MDLTAQRALVSLCCARLTFPYAPLPKILPILYQFESVSAILPSLFATILNALLISKISLDLGDC